MNKFLKYPNSLLIRGLIFFISAYYPFLLSEERRSHLVVITSMILFSLAVIDISEYISFKFGGNTLKKELYKSKDSKRRLLLGGLIGGLLLDGTMQWLAKFWVYPFWSNTFYTLIFIPAFAAYFLTVLESYTATKILLDYFSKGKRHIVKTHKFENQLFKLFEILGIIFSFIGVTLLVLNYRSIGRYIFNINYPVVLDKTISTVAVFITFFGIWLIIEYLLHRKKENSIISTSLHGYHIPVISTILSAYILLGLLESLNGPLFLWRYVNVPWEEIKVFNANSWSYWLAISKYCTSKSICPNF